MADGANVSIEKFADDGDAGGMDPNRLSDSRGRQEDGANITANLSKYQKIEFTRESIHESREMGLKRAEEHYRSRLDDLLRGEAE